MKSVLLVVVAAGLCAGAVSKRGIGSPSELTPCETHQALGKSSWYYNWGPLPRPYDVACAAWLGQEFVPSIWGPVIREQEIRTAVERVPGVKSLLGFNEPNHMEQSNITALYAAQLWVKVEQIADKLNLKLGSPSAAQCETTECLTRTPEEWWDQWQTECKNLNDGRPCRYDFLNIHYYGCDESALMNDIDRFWRRYRKPIWVTELCCPSSDINEVKRFMVSIMKQLDEDPRVERYAWFSTRTDGWLGSIPSLLDVDLKTRTTLGELYDS